MPRSESARRKVRPNFEFIGNTQRNVSAIIAMEHEVMAARSTAERVSDAIARQAGRIWFTIAHGVWFALWVLLNSGYIPDVSPFDKAPYPLLTIIVSLESIFLSLFILMSQNRSNRHADARAHLNLQINLLAEQESTKMLQMLEVLCRYHKLSVADDPELDHLTQDTQPADLLKELKENLPESC